MSLRLLMDHHVHGAITAGLLFCRSREFSIGRIIADLELVVRAVEADEIRNQVIWIPL